MAGDNGASLLEKMTDMDRRMGSLHHELREARRPVMLPGARVIEKYNRSATGHDGGAPSLGHFCKWVMDCATKYGGNWQGHKEMAGYMTKSVPSWVSTKTQPSGMNETTGQDGGFLIPPQFSQELLRRTYDNDLLSRTTLFPMTSNTLKIPTINETSRVNGSRFGGVQAYWRAEAGSVTATQPGFAQVTLSLEPLTMTCRVTDELLEDGGGSLETYINEVASQELQFKVGDAIFRGDGVSKPLGILNAPCKVTVSKETGQTSTDLIVHENIINMWGRMYAPSRANAVWLANQDTETFMHRMVLGGGVSRLPSYLPPGGLSGSPYSSLMGRPIVPCEFASTAGTEGDLVFVDLSQYLTGARQTGVQSAVSMHVYFLTSEQSFRFTMRLDGRPWWLAPLTPYKGTNTLSPIVTLETRP